MPASSRKDAQLFDLFKGHSAYVAHHWPGRNKEGHPFICEKSSAAGVELPGQCRERRGLFDPAERVRGRGGWVGWG